jgi:hypothetical protein
VLKVGSRDWVKKDYIINEVPGPLNLDRTNVVYPDDAVDAVRDEYILIVPILRQASMHNRHESIFMVPIHRQASLHNQC